MKEYKNKLVIIGNGFDLAHGLKTSYNDFIRWYLNSVSITKSQIADLPSYQYKDIILEVKFENNFQILNEAQNQQVFNTETILRGYYSRQFTVIKISEYFKKVLGRLGTCFWVDIENEFYQSLISLFLQYNENYHRRSEIIDELKRLNMEFNFIKSKLQEYLYTLNYITFKPNQDINSLFQSDYSVGYAKEDKNPKLVHYLNFNYSETIRNYIWPQSNYELNFIHGELNSDTNPIIFGYGDEIDKYYEEIQNLNINEFLNNFKSFGYFKTDNYSNLLRFIETEPFDVEILGHSCGLSDRVLLNTIFEHNNCASIKIHYHQKSETENDFLSKTQEISRHFKDKAKMRKRIVNFKDCKPLVKFKSQSK